jgi:F-type H+-transporting ATPase subunit b
MQEILTAFGIDWRLIVIQIFNFSILVGILWYFLYTPVLKLLSEREAKIKKGITDAEEAEKALLRADSEKTAILKDAHVEAGQIHARATLTAEEKASALIKDAETKIARDIESAKGLAEELKTQALKGSEAEIAKLSFLAAEKILNTELSK